MQSSIPYLGGFLLKLRVDLTHLPTLACETWDRGSVTDVVRAEGELSICLLFKVLVFLHVF